MILSPTKEGVGGVMVSLDTAVMFHGHHGQTAVRADSRSWAKCRFETMSHFPAPALNRAVNGSAALALPAPGQDACSKVKATFHRHIFRWNSVVMSSIASAGGSEALSEIGNTAPRGRGQTESATRSPSVSVSTRSIVPSLSLCGEFGPRIESLENPIMEIRTMISSESGAT
jgi:hypothetical protein